MATVGSASRVDGVDLQMMVSAANTFARPQTGTSATTHADAEPDARISQAGKLRGATSAVLDAAARLNKTQTWQATKATSDNEAVAQAVSDKASPGDYLVSVEAVATAQATASATFSSLSTVIGIGTLNIELGGWNTSQSTFATNPNWPKASVTFGPKDTSLEHIRDKINAAGVGVIAMVVSDATGSRLVLRSTSTGADNGFKASTEPGEHSHGDSEAAAQALAAMGFDPSKVSTGGATLTQAAGDAKLSVNGRQISSPHNLIEDEASGLTIRLNGATQGTANIHVETDTSAMAHDIHAFASAYNDMASQLAQSDPASTDSSLQAAKAIEQRMQEAFSPNSADAANLGEQFQAVGVQLGNDGHLMIDDARLGQALSQNLPQVEQLFSASGENGQSSGLATRLLSLPEAKPAEASQPATSATQPSSTDNPSAIGALFRQRLLEQYNASSKHDDDALVSANAA